MLSELPGVNRPINMPVAPQPRGVAAAAAPMANTSPDAFVSAASPGVSAESAAPKVQAPKPIEIKVDIEKMKAELRESLQKFNEAMRDGGRSLNFILDEKQGSLVILVKNTDTGELVRQIPSDVILRIAKNVEAFKGLLHNELS